MRKLASRCLGITGRALLAASAVLMIAGAAMAQSPSFLQPFAQRQTYSAAGSLAVPQTAAGDAVCIQGFAANATHSAGLVRVKRIEVSGTDTTVQAAELDLIVRSALDTGGTSTTATNVPHQSSNGAGSAIVKAYTAIPTAGTAVGTLAAAEVFFNIATAAVTPQLWEFNPGQLKQEPVLSGAAQSLCASFPAAFTTAGPVLKWRLEWTEQ